MLALTAALVAAFASFFGRYAFDDSFVGYGYAQSLLGGRGFAFNAGSHVLATSSPLAPFLYAALAVFMRGDVVAAAQLWSALALAVVAFGSYALARRISTPLGALLAALALTGSPFVLLLWSHETLLCAAACIAALVLYARGARASAAIVLGFAVLLRGEAILLLPFLWRGMRARERAYALAPLVLWCAIALPSFGSAFSSTLASKHAQLLYPQITPYLDGLRDYVTRMFAITPSFVWSQLLVVAALACAGCALACGLVDRLYVRVLLWSAATSALYVVLQMPFYFWFCAQIGVAIAAGVAFAFRTDLTARMPMLLTAGRAAAVLLAGLSVAFIVLQDVEPERKARSYDWIVNPRIGANPYFQLGTHMAQAPYRAASIGYPEIGEVHYYSGTPVVDYLGIATPGAVAALRDDEAIQTYQAYSPAAVVLSDNFRYFVDPREYDWFGRAYARGEALQYAGDPHRSRFVVYRLRDAAAVPPPLPRLARTGFERFFYEPDGIAVSFRPLEDARAVALRLTVPQRCTRFTVALSGGVATATRAPEHPAAMWFTRVSPMTRGRAYVLRVRGCREVGPAPRPALREGIIVLGKPPGPPAAAQDALRLYGARPSGV